MLPLGVGLEANLWTSEAREAVKRARSDLAGRPGIIQPDRLERNLLSSQPLAFNLFGYLASYAEALLPWVNLLDPEASAVTDVRLEWAPSEDPLGGSAFDAFVEYQLPCGSLGFVGVEVKYNEDLSNAQPKPAAAKYVAETSARGSDWQHGAAKQLDQPKLRQFWFNQLLAQRTLDRAEYSRGFEIVVACEADTSAREVTADVAALLMEPDSLRFAAIEDVVATIDGHEKWKQTFTERYTDFTPIKALLSDDDPRR